MQMTQTMQSIIFVLLCLSIFLQSWQSVKQIDEDDQERMGDEEEDDKKKKYPDMLDLLFYLEQTGVGLPRHEMVLLNLSIRKFASTMPVENIRYIQYIQSKYKNGAILNLYISHYFLCIYLIHIFFKFIF